MQKFPEDIQCIIEPSQGSGGIYISNIEAAQNPSTLKKYGIEAVITAIKGKNLDKVIPKHIQYLYIPAVDHESFDISYYFQVSNKFIQDQRQRTNVLVHCMAGISRSVTLVIAYMMKHMGKTYNQAYNLVKQKRKIIHPNDSFINQLQTYEKTINRQSLSQLSSKHDNLQKVQNFQSKTVDSLHFRVLRNSAKIESSYDENLKTSIRALFKKRQKENSSFYA